MNVGGTTSVSPDWRTIRSSNVSQARAFEEISYLLRYDTPSGAQVTKTGDPDGGFEWYLTHRNGVQWGWQAKYTFDIDSALKLMERKSAREKFEDRKRSWAMRIQGASRVRIDLLTSGDLLDRLASHRDHRGKIYFFWNLEVFDQNWCRRKLAATITSAGPRYTPELNVELPISGALDALRDSSTFRRTLAELCNNVSTAANAVADNTYKGSGLARARAVVSEARALSRSLGRQSQVEECLTIDRVRVQATQLLERTQVVRAGLHGGDRQDKDADLAAELARYARMQLSRFERSLEDLVAFLSSAAARANESGTLLLIGDPGQGKTHLMCDAGSRAVEEGRPAVVLLGQRFSGRNIWGDIAEQLGLGAVGSEVVIGAMRAAAAAA